MPHLASRILVASRRFLCDDWQRIYHHSVYFAETFIDPERSRGTCYRAANWVRIGLAALAAGQKEAETSCPLATCGASFDAAYRPLGDGLIASGQRRNKQHRPLPLARFTTELGLTEELRRASKAGCDFAFIDTPPGRNSETPAAVESSDLVLIRFRNDQGAYEDVARTVLLAKRLGKPAYGVLNFE